MRILRIVVVRLVFAVTWLAAWHWFHTHLDSFKPASDENFVIGFGLIAGEVISLALAVGALFGKWGWLIAFGMACAYLAFILIAISIVGI